VGDLGTCFYIILQGKVGIYILLPEKVDSSKLSYKKVAELRGGDTFGELALLSDSCKRTATVTALSDCHLGFIEK